MNNNFFEASGLINFKLHGHCTRLLRKQRDLPSQPDSAWLQLDRYAMVWQGPAWARPGHGLRASAPWGQLRPGELRPGELRTGELRTGELRPGELRTGELRPGELRPGELGPGELGSGELILAELRTGEPRPGELRPAELMIGGRVS